MEVTFETKCWENDYKLMLRTNHLKRMIENCNYSFARKQLIINNCDNVDLVLADAGKLKAKQVIDDIFVAANYSETVLNEFEIDKDSFGGGGYYYSIAELVGIYCCKTKYLLHFSSDSYIPTEFKQSCWIEEAIRLMEKDPNIVVANPTWNYNWKEAEAESTAVVGDGSFFLGSGFSDQCYLINTERFKDKIYNYHHICSERYPKYGGELFEKRVDSFMRVHGKNRITSTSVSYVSKNIGKSRYYLEKMGFIKL